MKNEMKSIIENVLKNRIECDNIEFIENGVKFIEFEEYVNEIVIEGDKVVYKGILDDEKELVIKINLSIFEKDVENYTYKLWDMSLMLSEGDIETDELDNLYFDLSDEEFLNFS